MGKCRSDCRLVAAEKFEIRRRKNFLRRTRSLFRRPDVRKSRRRKVRRSARSRHRRCAPLRQQRRRRRLQFSRRCSRHRPCNWTRRVWIAAWPPSDCRVSMVLRRLTRTWRGYRIALCFTDGLLETGCAISRRAWMGMQRLSCGNCRQPVQKRTC